jgi:transcriptional regulator with XRE-family HTH domain
MQLARTKEWRESRGFTQRELAAEAGISEVTVARLETGHSGTPSTARKIAQALVVSVADLLERPPVPLVKASQAREPEAKGSAVPPLPKLSLAALSPEELETQLFGAPVGEGEVFVPVLTVEEAHRLVRDVRSERDALEDWVEAYATARPEDQLRARREYVRANKHLARARLYYLVLLDYWSKLADPRGVPLKGVLRIASETAEAQGLMQDIKRHQDELRRLAKGESA